MNSSLKPRFPVRHLWWLLPLITVFLVPAILAASVVSCLRLNGETRALRDSVMDSSKATWKKQIEISLGGTLFALARLGVSFIEVEPEVRAGIETVRGVRVGVYEFAGGSKRLPFTDCLNGADQSLTESGWERLVAVVNRDDMVAVYAQPQRADCTEIEICVVVVNKHDLVIVSARANPEPLLELAMKELEKEIDHGSRGAPSHQIKL